MKDVRERQIVAERLEDREKGRWTETQRELSRLKAADSRHFI